MLYVPSALSSSLHELNLNANITNLLTENVRTMLISPMQKTFYNRPGMESAKGLCHTGTIAVLRHMQDVCGNYSVIVLGPYNAITSNIYIAVQNYNKIISIKQIF